MVGEQVLMRDIGAEESGIVGIERNQETGIEVVAQWVVSEGCADAGADVRGWIELQRDLSGFQLFDQTGILNG